KRRAWFCQMTGTLPPLLDSRGGWRHARMKILFYAYGSSLLCQGGETGKSVKKLRSGDLLIETSSAVQTKSFLLAKSFLCSPANITPHKSLNSSRRIISEPDLLTTSDAEILEGFSSQGVIQVRRITLKKDTTLIPTKHLILTFSSPTLPHPIKAGYLNCKIRPYIPNPLRCFKCQRFGHSQTACRGQLTCSRCASVGHSSADCSLAQKCVNCSQPHSSDSKQCPKWKAEKEIQAIKTNRNISYLEARKLIAPQLSQTYAQVAKPSTFTSTTQTDENITHIKCPPLQLLQPLLSVPQPDKSNSVSALSSLSATQADLLSSTSSNAPSTNDMFTSIGTSSPIIPTSSSHSVIQPPSASTIQDTKKISKVRARKRKKEILKKMKDTVFEIKMAQHRPRKPASVEYTTDEEDTIVYDMGEEVESPKNGSTPGLALAPLTLNSLTHSTEHRHSTVIEILLLLRKLERKGFDIIFSWVPGHVGILGNEQADTAARSMSDHMQRPVCYQDLKTSAQNYIHRVWQETWDQQVFNKLHSIHPSTSHWAALPVRRHDVHLTRLRIGRLRFTHRHLLLGENAPECPIFSLSYFNKLSRF
ncbi:RNase H domain-containing protein, partial [Trichonephila clavipes]